MLAPPLTVKLPPAVAFVAFVVFEKFTLRDELKVSFSTDNPETVCNGLVPLPIINLFAKKEEVPVPP